MRSSRAPRHVRAGPRIAWRSRTLIVVLVLALGAALTLAVRAALSGEALDPPPAAPATSSAAAFGLVAPTSTVRPQRPATAPVQPGPRCRAGGVSIGTSDDAQQIVDAHPAGTTFWSRPESTRATSASSRNPATPSAASPARCWTAGAAWRRRSPAAPTT